MTRDELTKRINDLGYEDYAAPLEVALLAVLGLHKEYVSPNILDTKTVCMHCSGRVEDVVYYPCLTVRVIEKELS